MPASVALSPTATAAPAGTSGLARLWRRLAAMLVVARERRELHGLDDHLLADIGLDRHTVEAEYRRPFWDLPANFG
jgi:uncharacterized protein YjiS (DUF1127 family)